MIESATQETSLKTMRKPRRYSSNPNGQFAVNAITGEKYPYRVGTYDALRLFRVQDTTSTYNSDGKVIKSGDRSTSHSREPKFLYYDGPKDYMAHNNITLNQQYIEKWKKFQDNLLDDKGKVNIQAYNEYLKTRNMIG